MLLHFEFVQPVQTGQTEQQRSENNDHPLKIGHISITLTFGKCESDGKL